MNTEVQGLQGVASDNGFPATVTVVVVYAMACMARER